MCGAGMMPSHMYIYRAIAVCVQRRDDAVVHALVRRHRPLVVPSRDCNGSKGGDEFDAIFFSLIEARTQFRRDDGSAGQRRGRMNCRAEMAGYAPAEGRAEGPKKDVHRGERKAPAWGPDGLERSN